MNLLPDCLDACQRYSDRIALQDESSRISYAELQSRIQSLSGLFQPGQRIAVALERGVEAAVVILSILHAGGCYIPLDIKNPASRLKTIIDDAQPAAVIGSGTRPDWLNPDIPWLTPDMQRCQQQPNLQPPESLAAILYTSGSTGKPKGVALSHRAMHNFARWAGKTFAISSSDKIASLAPFFFDLSVFDLFTSLAAGAHIHFIPTALTLSPSRLTQWLADHAITVWYTVPSLLGFLALKGNLAQTPLPHLRTLLFAGEVFPTPALRQLTRLLPQTDFYNLYGPTETNVCCYWPVERQRLADNTPIPIGWPAAGAELKITPESGELCVKSANNFTGYWKNGRLHSAIPPDGFYPTGDKVSINTHGEICYHGRLDRLLKCSGFRVEPAEIEAAICQHPHVAQCAVIGIKDKTAGQRPAAAIVLSQDTALAEIIQPHRQTLPAYMLPSQVKIVDRLPTLATGKIDYSTLTALFT